MTEKVKPDSEKSTVEQASETVSGYADKGMASVQPCKRSHSDIVLALPTRVSASDKSAAQKLTDSTRASGTDEKQGTSGLVDSISKNITAAKDALAGVTGSASKTASGE